MEAATPLRQARVGIVGDRLVVHDLDVQDECAVRLVRERDKAGDDPAKTVRDAIEIGARVLDREQAAANSEYVKTEFERASRELEREFTDKARTVAEHFGTKVDEVFGPESGRLARDLEKLFGEGSSASVQNRVRELVSEALVKSREDLVRQFSAADGSNPLADFKAGALETITQAANRSHATERALLQQLGELRKELQGAARREGEARGGRRRARARHRQGPDLRGGGGGFDRRPGAAPGRRGRGGGGSARRRRQDRRRGRGHRCLPRPGARAGGVRGQGPPAVEAGGARGARPGARRPRRGLRGAGGAHRRGAAGQARAPARVQRGQAAGGTRSGRSRRARPRGRPTGWRAPAC